MPLFTKVYRKGRLIGRVEKRPASYVVSSGSDPRNPGRRRVVVKLHGRVVEEKGNIDSAAEQGRVFRAMKNKYGRP